MPAQLPFELSQFVCLSVLSCTDHFARVELVQHTAQSSSARVTPFVLKSVDKTWSWKLRKQCSALNELAVLRLAQRDSGSPPVPKLFGSFLSTDEFHIVMEYAHGGDLYTMLESSPNGLEERLVKAWIAEAAEALEWLHSRGWCHRDIKPHNLLLNSFGRILLTDFGSAAQIDEKGRVDADDAQAMIGTPDYIAPEILLFAEQLALESESDSPRANSNAKAYDARVDWWSLGATAYELLTGQSPFFAESIAETYERIVQHNLTLSIPSTISLQAQACLRSLLSDARDRCSAEGLRQSDWLRSEPWGHFAEKGLNRPYVPPPYDPARYASPAPNRSTRDAFDFTAFFSSPGLSILRTAQRSSSSTTAPNRDQVEYWADAVTLPPADFASSTSVSASSAPLPSFADRFETPIAPRRQSVAAQRPSSSSSSNAEPHSTARRGKSKRAIDGIEAWREMADHAWSVGRQQALAASLNQNGRPAPAAEEVVRPTEGEPKLSEDQDSLSRLERRHEALRRDIGNVEQKYRHLFEMASKSHERTSNA